MRVVSKLSIENSLEQFRNKFIEVQTQDYLLNYKMTALSLDDKYLKSYAQAIRDIAEIILSYDEIAYCLQEASLNAYNKNKSKGL